MARLIRPLAFLGQADPLKVVEVAATLSFGWTLVGSVNVARVAATQAHHLFSVVVVFVAGGALVWLAVSTVSSLLLFLPLGYFLDTTRRLFSFQEVRRRLGLFLRSECVDYFVHLERPHPQAVHPSCLAATSGYPFFVVFLAEGTVRCQAA